MNIVAALTRVGSVTFAVVQVRNSVVSSMFAAREAIADLQPLFPGMPIVVMGYVGERPKYVGRDDLIRFLARTNPQRLPWRKYWFG